MDTNAQLERGTFRLASYEWGVTYSAMLAAAEATGDEAYKKYVYDRFKFLSEVAPYFKKVYEKYGTTDAQMLQILKNIIGSAEFGDKFKMQLTGNEMYLSTGLITSQLASQVFTGIGLPAIEIKED